MSTWHQDRGPRPKFQQETDWCVVVDPPGEMTSCALFSEEQLAKEYIKDKKHVFIVPPRSIYKKTP